MSVQEAELLEEISGFLHGYLKSGQVKINSFLSKTNHNIDNLEQLLKVRFLLKNETKDFVKDLPQSLKRFRTSTRMNNETLHGEIRGQIDWGQTIVERLSTNYKDTTLFSTNESIRAYDTPENLVLKELVGILYHLIYQDTYLKGFEQAKWFSEWQQLKGNVAYAFKKNVYLKRVSLIHVSDRDIQRTLTHRNKVYRDAAQLLLFYRNLTNGNFSEQDLQTMLHETFISPDNQDVLFELYWVVQLIKQNTEASKLYLMDGSQNKVASWEDEAFRYNLYHDSVGSGHMKFSVQASEVAESENPYLQKKYQSFQLGVSLTQELFGRTSNALFWSGRPDFLLEIYDIETNELVKVIIGEVKNTSDINYVITGLKELIDYIYLVKDRKDRYLLGTEVSIQGMLCVKDIDVKSDLKIDLIKVVTTRKGARIT